MSKKQLIKGLGGYSYNQLRRELETVIMEKYGTKSQSGDYYTNYPIVTDLYEEEVVISYKGKYYIADYNVDKSGNITLGEFYDAKMIPKKTGTTPSKIK